MSVGPAKIIRECVNKMIDKESRRNNMKVNLKRQLKGLIKAEDNLVNAIAYFVVGALLLVAGAITGMAFLGLVGGGCIILGLERLVRRSADKSGGTMSDLRADEEKNRQRGNK